MGLLIKTMQYDSVLAAPTHHKVFLFAVTVSEYFNRFLGSQLGNRIFCNGF